jgi:hypothetical protein
VPASDLIVSVLQDESTRLFGWACEHAPVAVARPATADAFSKIWPRAVDGWRTADGPFAFLLAATEAGIRERPPRVGSYLPASARWTCSMPTLPELLRIATVYSWLAMANKHVKLEFTHSSMVVSLIRTYAITDPIARAVQRHQYEATHGRAVFNRLLAVVDELVEAEGEPAAAAVKLANREFERSRRWLLKRTLQVG